MALNISEEIRERLPGEVLEVLREAGELAAAHSQSLYLVGGAVRDIFLGRPNLDLDLVVEGDAPQLARELAQARGGEVVTHPHFGTASFRMGGFNLDLAMARRESYARPGALPTVTPGTIESDLLRRDFSINAMAVHLDITHFGELFDPYGGRDDLDRSLIQVLHPESFRDDPTRIWRALRYEQRLGFKLEQATEGLLRRDTAMMDLVSGDRLRHELELILKEELPERTLYRADELGVLARLHHALKGNGWLAERFQQARRAAGDATPEPGLYLALLVWRLPAEENESLINRLRIGRKTAQVMRDALSLKQALPDLSAPDLRPSGIYRLVEGYSPLAVSAASIASESSLGRQRLELYLSTLRYVKPSLDGNDLKTMGVPPGRRLGQILRALHEAKLDRRLNTREEEQELVRQSLSGSKG